MMIALTPRIPICRTAQYFNPHFRKGSDRAAAIYRMPGKYFNPHFRKGSDKIATGFPIERVISIHTSAREVTERDIVDMVADIISIHTSAREVTKTVSATEEDLRDFNPHFRKGSDNTMISDLYSRDYFNPHFRKGSDAFTIERFR